MKFGVIYNVHNYVSVFLGFEVVLRYRHFNSDDGEDPCTSCKQCMGDFVEVSKCTPTKDTTCTKSNRQFNFFFASCENCFFLFLSQTPQNHQKLGFVF